MVGLYMIVYCNTSPKYNTTFNKSQGSFTTNKKHILKYSNNSKKTFVLDIAAKLPEKGCNLVILPIFNTEIVMDI